MTLHGNGNARLIVRVRDHLRRKQRAIVVASRHAGKYFELPPKSRLRSGAGCRQRDNG